MILTKRFEEALIYSSLVHAGQRRKGTEIPYISHLLAVASIVLEHEGSEDEAIGALLHDAVEDAGGKTRLEDIRCRFGDVVARIVDGCSDTDIIPKPPWKERKQKYIEHVRVASPSVRLVSASDKLHNAQAILRDYRELRETLWDRFNAPRDDILLYYRSLVQAFRDTAAIQRVSRAKRGRPAGPYPRSRRRRQHYLLRPVHL